MTMKRPLSAPLLAISLVSGCASITTARNCETALAGLQTASEIISALRAAGIEESVADKLAPLLAIGKIGVTAACAGV